MLYYIKGVALLALAAALLSFSWLLLTVRVVVEQTPAIVQSTVHTEMQALRADLRAEIAETRKTLDRQLTTVRKSTEEQVGVTRSEVLARVDTALLSADAQLTAVNTSIAHVAKLRDDIQPAIQEVNALSGPISRNTLGLIAAAKVTAGETASTMRHVRLATPEIIASAKRIADNSDKTTELTKDSMANLKRATTPLPRWLSIPFSLAVPTAQVLTPWLAFGQRVNVVTDKGMNP